MADEPQLRDLEYRITRLEDQLRRRQDASDDVISTFLRIEKALTYGGPDKKCAPVQINVNLWVDDEQGPPHRRFGPAPGSELPGETDEPDGR